jgi:acyl-CoA thioesterase FadM
MSVMLRAEEKGSADAVAPSLRNIVCDAIVRGESATFPAPATPRLDPSLGRGESALDVAIASGIVPADANAFAWLWRIPYFYCYYNDRLRHSGYLRLMEEVEDLLLEARGISIKSMVDNKRLIPVVSHAAVSMVGEAYMEERILTVYRIEEIFKGFTYRSSMDCYVERQGRYVLVQRGSITHGYARMLNRRDWKLEAFDAPTLTALQSAS